MDQHLAGEYTVNMIVNTSMARLKSMYRPAGVLSKKSRQLMASSLVQCLFDYAATSWCIKTISSASYCTK